MLDRRINAFKIADGAQIDEQVKLLAECHIERAGPATGFCARRAFDADFQISEDFNDCWIERPVCETEILDFVRVVIEA